MKQKLVEELYSYGVRLDEPALLQEVSGILVELMNHSRKWENCGHTPHELYQQQHPQQVGAASEDRQPDIIREIDFIVVHPAMGFVTIEVKQGDVMYQDGVFHELKDRGRYQPETSIF